MGKLIAIEGIDGSGKGTLAKTLAELLRRDGQTVLVIRYPRYRSGPFGRMIGAYLNGKGVGSNRSPMPLPVSMPWTDGTVCRSRKRAVRKMTG